MVQTCAKQSDQELLGKSQASLDEPRAWGVLGSVASTFLVILRTRLCHIGRCLSKP